MYCRFALPQLLGSAGADCLGRRSAGHRFGRLWPFWRRPGCHRTGRARSLFIDQTIVRDCGTGVWILAPTPTSRKQFITDCEIEGANYGGVFADGYGDVTVRNSAVVGKPAERGIWARTGVSAGVSQR